MQGLLAPEKLKPLWTCPKCGVRLVTKNLWHSCGRFTLKALFAASEPSVLALAKRYIAMVQSLGDDKDDLQLTGEQVRRLQDLDDQLERQNAALRQEAEKRQSQGPSSSGAFGRGMGGRSRGAAGGRSMGGTRTAPSTATGPKSAEERIDDNDTNAYLEAEKVLTEAQRARAMEIASKFRQESWDRRHAARKPSDQ